jgi:hypothetical protein
MYLSAERLAVANQAVQETFEQSSVAWQAIPNWDTGDPGQTQIQSDSVSGYLVAPPPPPAGQPPATPAPGPLGGAPLNVVTLSQSFDVTLAQALAPKPDALLAAAIARTTLLAQKVDTELTSRLLDLPQFWPPQDIPVAETDANLLSGLINARVNAENHGYRAPSCLLTDKVGLKALSQFEGGVSILGELLNAANINSLHRVEKLELAAGPATAANNGRMLLLGRRQRIAHGCASSASPGEEPVDLAVSVPPSLEVIGETATGNITLAVRIHFAVRVKDKFGVIGVDTR